MTEHDQTRNSVQEFFHLFADAWKANDGAVLAGFFVGDGALINPFGQRADGRGAIGAMYSGYFEGMLQGTSTAFKLEERAGRRNQPCLGRRRTDDLCGQWRSGPSGAPCRPAPPRWRRVAVRRFPSLHLPSRSLLSPVRTWEGTTLTDGKAETALRLNESLHYPPDGPRRDLGAVGGQPMEHMVRACLVALRLAEQLGLDGSQRTVVYYSGLLAWVGCHTDAYERAKWLGDDLAVKRYAHYGYDLGRVVPTTAFKLQHIGGAGRPLLERARSPRGS